VLTQTLAGLLRALSEHAKHYGTIPNAALLDPANFQGQRGQRSARMSSLLDHVLLSQRLQFLHPRASLLLSKMPFASNLSSRKPTSLRASL
jgi:hypothetical protein